MKWQYQRTLSTYTDSAASTTLWNLDPGESYRQTILITHDTSAHVAYQIQYDPSKCKMFDYVFAPTDSAGNLLGQNSHIAEILPWNGPLRSNTFSPSYTSIEKPNLPSLGMDIYLCRWKKLTRKINNGMPMPSVWPVINDQMYSQMVLSSLPSFSFHSYIAETKQGIQSIQLQYQLGKIFKLRSRIASLFRCLGIRNTGWRLSDESAVKLIVLTSRPYTVIFR